MASGIVFDERPIDELVEERYVLELLKKAGIRTVGDLQRALITGKKIYLIGPARTQYLQGLLRQEGLTASQPWTDRLYRVLYASGTEYKLISTEGERLLVNRLMYWLHDSGRIPHSEASADPVFIFFGRLGIGRLRPANPMGFGDYRWLEVVANGGGRYDDVIQRSDQLARVTGVEVEEVNKIYQRCLSLLRSEECKKEILEIYDGYGEVRR